MKATEEEAPETKAADRDAGAYPSITVVRRREAEAKVDRVSCKPMSMRLPTSHVRAPHVAARGPAYLSASIRRIPKPARWHCRAVR